MTEKLLSEEEIGGIIPWDVVERIAKIIGAGSAGERALEARKTMTDPVCIFTERGLIVIERSNL